MFGLSTDRMVLLIALGVGFVIWALAMAVPRRNKE